MSTESFASTVPSSRSRRRAQPGLVGAEFLKLRKRRGLVLSTVALTVVPMVIGYAVVAGKHASDPEKNGPGGGTENFVQSVELLSGLAALAAIIVGVMAGTGDLRAGVFRELVVTGRSRVSLFLARIPGGLALVVPVAAAAFAVAATASFVLADGAATPDSRLLGLSGVWIALLVASAFLFALGLSSVVGSTGPSIGVLLGWQAILAPLLLSLDSLGVVRSLLPGAGLTELAPSELELESALSMAPAAAVANIVVWMLIPLAAGAWRTATRDA